MFEPNSVYAKIAYDTILLYVKTNHKLEKRESEIPDALKLKLGCNVSIYDSDEKLRARYGTPYPKQNYLFHEIIENAIIAAKGGSNAEPLAEKELNNISIHVDVFSKPKQIENQQYLKPHKHGIIIESEKGDPVMIFPNQDGIENPEQMITKARKKAGVEDKDENEINIQYFTTTTYK